MILNKQVITSLKQYDKSTTFEQYRRAGIEYGFYLKLKNHPEKAIMYIASNNFHVSEIARYVIDNPKMGYTEWMMKRMKGVIPQW